MITVKNFSKLLSMSEQEVQEYIRKMNEKDAKDLLIKLINFMNQRKNNL